MKKILILGTGCAKCKKLFEDTEKAANELKLQYEISKVEDIEKILSYGIMVTPALVVDDVVKVAGRVPSMDELKKLLF